MAHEYLSIDASLLTLIPVISLSQFDLGAMRIEGFTNTARSASTLAWSEAIWTEHHINADRHAFFQVLVESFYNFVIQAHPISKKWPWVFQFCTSFKHFEMSSLANAFSGFQVVVCSDSAALWVHRRLIRFYEDDQ